MVRVNTRGAPERRLADKSSEVSAGSDPFEPQARGRVDVNKFWWASSRFSRDSPAHSDGRGPAMERFAIDHKYVVDNAFCWQH